MVYISSDRKKYFTNNHKGYNFFLVKQSNEISILIDIKRYDNDEDFDFLSAPFPVYRIDDICFDKHSIFKQFEYKFIGHTFYFNDDMIVDYLFNEKKEILIINACQIIDELIFFFDKCLCERLNACSAIKLAPNLFLRRDIIKMRFNLYSDSHLTEVSYCPLCGESLYKKRF